MGQPVLEEHIYTIVKSVASKHKDKPYLEELLIMCILHDVIEDDLSANKEELIINFGENIVSKILLLTKTTEENAHGCPQEQKAATNRKILKRLESAPVIAQITKLESRLNNISCIEKIDKPKFLRYVQETKKSYIPFAISVNQPLYADLLSKEAERLSSRN